MVEYKEKKKQVPSTPEPFTIGRILNNQVRPKGIYIKRDFMALLKNKNNSHFAGRIKYNARRNAFYVSYVNTNKREWLKLCDVLSLIANDGIAFFSDNDRKMFLEKVSKCQDIQYKSNQTYMKMKRAAIPVAIGVSALAAGAIAIMLANKRSR